MKILLRKIEVILKRTASVNRLIFADEYLYIDLDHARVTVKGQECPVTPTECRLLRQFIMNRGQLLTYDLLLERLWDSRRTVCGQARTGSKCESPEGKD